MNRREVPRLSICEHTELVDFHLPLYLCVPLPSLLPFKLLLSLLLSSALTLWFFLLVSYLAHFRQLRRLESLVPSVEGTISRFLTDIHPPACRRCCSRVLPRD